ncbi:retrotransposon protein, putative, ty1-copia subclass [Tanacetum coccineum]
MVISMKRILHEQPEVFQSKIAKAENAKLKRSIYGLNKHQGNGIAFDDEIKKFGFIIPNVTRDVKSYLGKCFAMKDLGEAAYILGIKIYRDRSRRLIGLCQSAYIEKILKRFHMENSKRGSIPWQKSKIENITSLIPTEIQELHWTTVHNILKLEMCSFNRVQLTGRVPKQSIFFYSICKAEYIAAFDASKEAVWVRKFISGLGVVPTIEKPINMYCDNTRAFAIANESGITKDDNLADPFTKALAFPKHSELTRNIGMLPGSSFITIGYGSRIGGANVDLFRCFLERVRLRRSRHAKRMKMMAARHELHRNMAEKEEANSNTNTNSHTIDVHVNVEQHAGATTAKLDGKWVDLVRKEIKSLLDIIDSAEHRIESDTNVVEGLMKLVLQNMKDTAKWMEQLEPYFT